MNAGQNGPPNGEPVFDARALTFRYPGAAAPAIADVTLRVEPGLLYAVIGPNGSGKSTLLRLLLGLIAPVSGTIRYAGRPLAEWPRRELARQVGVVPQAEETFFPIRVRELVAMGRYPHLGAFRPEGPADRAAVLEALTRCDLQQLANRALATLSAGERQRARLARALAQRPATLVLDEPTASLDVRHEMEGFELLAELSGRERVNVLLVTHNLNLAARYADRLLLMDRGRAAAQGAPAAVLTRPVLESVYGWPLAVTCHPGPGVDAGAPQVLALRRDPRAGALARVPEGAADTRLSLPTTRGEP